MSDYLLQYPRAQLRSQVVDTVLAKLFAQDEKTTDLYALLDNGSHEIDVMEVKETFIRSGQYNALLQLFRLRALHDELLEGCSKYVPCRSRMPASHA